MKYVRLPALKAEAGSPLAKWIQRNRKRVKKLSPKRPILLREKLVRTELAAAKLGIRETSPNHGPWIKKFLAEVGLPEGYPWCAAFQSFELHTTTGRRLPIESASVGAIYNYAKSHGWLLRRSQRPRRGDWVLFNWKGAGPPYADHIALVVKVLALGPILKLRTVEGNTAPAGQPEGVYLRTRTIPAKQVAFVRIPGKVQP